MIFSLCNFDKNSAALGVSPKEKEATMPLFLNLFIIIFGEFFINGRFF